MINNEFVPKWAWRPSSLRLRGTEGLIALPLICGRFSAKVIIQAKRYKNTVGVSAVRDLFGTMHNEGASKGILVTTSGYGRAAYEFANGKPLELITGSNLLYLLEEHAGTKAKIEVPEEWVDRLDIEE